MSIEMYLETLTKEEKQVLEIVKKTFELKTEADLHDYIRRTIGYIKYQKQSASVNPPLNKP